MHLLCCLTRCYGPWCLPVCVHLHHWSNTNFCVKECSMKHEACTVWRKIISPFTVRLAMIAPRLFQHVHCLWKITYLLTVTPSEKNFSQVAFLELLHFCISTHLHTPSVTQKRLISIVLCVVAWKLFSTWHFLYPKLTKWKQAMRLSLWWGLHLPVAEISLSPSLIHTIMPSFSIHSYTQNDLIYLRKSLSRE